MADQRSEDVHDSAGQLKETTTDAEQQENDLVNEVIDNLKFVKGYEQLQRQCEEEENEFEAIDMWGEEARNRRAEQKDESTGTTVPAKPTISANLLDHDIQTNLAEARQARLSLTVKPKSGLALKKTGQYIKGLVRTIQIESGSLEIRLWGLERAMRVGRGGWMLEAVYANDGDFDLDLRERRILDYGTVYWDAYRQRADNADADWCLVSDWISEKERLRRWKDKPLIVPQNAWEADHDWFAADAENPANRRVRIGLYYKVIHEMHVLGYHPQQGQGWLDTAPKKSKVPMLPAAAIADVQAKAPNTRQREVDVPRVEIYTVDGAQILEEAPWHGKYIPVIETIGKEYYWKGKRRWKGKIANTQDLLRAINVLLSAATEIAGQMPRAPYLMAVGQDEGLESMWDDAAVKNLTRLYYNTKDIEGNIVGAPQRQQIELQVQGLLLLLRMMHEMYHTVSGSVAPQMRAVNPQERSGRYIEALQRQGAAGTSNYLDNMATISMVYEGKVLLDAVPNYYDTPGRLLYVASEEQGDEIGILIKRPFIRDAQGMPVAVPCPTCKGKGTITSWNPFVGDQPCKDCEGTGFPTKETMPQAYQDKEVEYVDFSDGEFQIVAALDRDFHTQQEEALAGMEALAKAVPELVPLYADLWVRAMSFKGSTEIADRIKSRMPGGDDEALKDIPPHLLGRFQQLQERHDQAMQALQEAQKMLDTDAVKAAGQKEIAMIREAVRGKVEQLKAQGKMLEVKAGVEADERLEMLRGRLEAMRLDSEQRHETMLQKLEERHEIVLQLLKEKANTETERHSVALHDAAAAAAAERADLSAAAADTRKEGMAERADVRKDASGVTADTRKEAGATRADTRKEVMAERADTRAEASAERADQRAETAAEQAAKRDLQKPDKGA